MNSLDPWRVIMTDPAGNVLLPKGYYRHPFYQEVPSWIHYGDDSNTHRLLFDGVFVGTNSGALEEMRNVMKPRSGLTAEVGPILAPATGGITFRKELDDTQTLHVEICVDGRCYRTSMDLAPAISMIMHKLARWHGAEHAAMSPSKNVKTMDPVVVSTVNEAVGAATESLIGALVARHVDCACGGFFGDIAAAACHVQETAKKAARGDSQAQQKIVKVADDAERGDDAAKAVAGLIADAMQSEWGATLWEKATGRGPAAVGGAWHDFANYPTFNEHATIGAVPETTTGAKLADIRRRAQQLASSKEGAVVGVIYLKKDNTWYLFAFDTLDDSIGWLQRATRDRALFTYAAVYEKTPDGLAFIQDEEVGGSRRPAAPPAELIRRGVATTTGSW